MTSLPPCLPHAALSRLTAAILEKGVCLHLMMARRRGIHTPHRRSLAAEVNRTERRKIFLPKIQSIHSFIHSFIHSLGSERAFRSSLIGTQAERAGHTCLSDSLRGQSAADTSFPVLVSGAACLHRFYGPRQAPASSCISCYAPRSVLLWPPTFLPWPRSFWGGLVLLGDNSAGEASQADPLSFFLSFFSPH